MDQRGPYGTHRHVIDWLSVRRTHIFEHPTATPKRRQEHPRGNTKIRDESQALQVRIPPKRNRIPRVHHWTRRGQDRPSQDTSHMGLENTQENQGNPMLPRILQLLPTIYRRIQQDSQTAVRRDKKEMHRQPGIGRQRAKSIQGTKDKAHHSTSAGLFQPPRHNQDRNRGLKICLVRQIIATMPRREMETGGIPIQDHVKCRMQLRYT